jgi:hypothetical protein
MPAKKCSKDGKSGWKWGDKGTCYTGPGAKKKALKQGYTIDKDKFAAKATFEELRILYEMVLAEGSIEDATKVEKLFVIKMHMELNNDE